MTPKTDRRLITGENREILEKNQCKHRRAGVEVVGLKLKDVYPRFWVLQVPRQGRQAAHRAAGPRVAVIALAAPTWRRCGRRLTPALRRMAALAVRQPRRPRPDRSCFWVLFTNYVRRAGLTPSHPDTLSPQLCHHFAGRRRRPAHLAGACWPRPTSRPQAVHSRGRPSGLRAISQHFHHPRRRKTGRAAVGAGGP